MIRKNGRRSDQLRKISFDLDVALNSHGSVMVSFGETKVICSAVIEPGIPRWMIKGNKPGGWITAEYQMLPYSTLNRKSRDINRGSLDARSVEIQRLIGRVMRAVIDVELLGKRTLWIDCDVLQADGGTRTASITGASLATKMAIMRFMEKGLINKCPMKDIVGAVSVGIYQSKCLLDLDYLEDKNSSVDFNYVMNQSLQIVEIQGGGEGSTFSEIELSEILKLGKEGIKQIIDLQVDVLKKFNPKNNLEILSRIV